MKTDWPYKSQIKAAYYMFYYASICNRNTLLIGDSKLVVIVNVGGEFKVVNLIFQELQLKIPCIMLNFYDFKMQ